MELPNLIVLIRNGSNGSEHPLCHGTTVEGVGQCEDFFLNLWSRTKKIQNLCYTGTGDSLPSCDLGLVPDLAGIDLTLPLDSFSEEFHHSGGLGFRRRFLVPAAGGDHV